MSNPAVSSTGATVHTIRIGVRDMQEMVSFYGAALELGPAFPPGGTHRGFHLGDVYLGFDLVAGSSSDHSATTSVWFEVNDIEATFARMIDLGATAKEAPHPGPWGAAVATLLDPEGNMVGLTQRRARTKTPEI